MAGLLGSRVEQQRAPITDASGQNRGEKQWPPMGRNVGHHWGDSMATYGEVPMATVNTKRSECASTCQPEHHRADEPDGAPSPGCSVQVVTHHPNRKSG